MNKGQSTTFIIISIIVLVGFFMVIMIVGFFQTLNTNFIQSEPVDNVNVSVGENKYNDPLITSNKEIYYSLFSQEDPVLGGDEARLFILEFGDFECFYCANTAPALRQVLNQFEGDVSLVWKDFPNPVHLQARPAALAARCAKEQGKFWEYHDYLFANQDDLSRDMYNKIALELQLDLTEFNNCLDTQKYIEIVGQGLVDGQKLEVDATPYLFIGNTRVDQVISAEELAGIIRKELGQE